jgi:transposase
MTRKIKYIRCAKAINCRFNNDFMRIHNETISHINSTMHFIIDKFKSKEFTDIKGKKDFVLSDGTTLSQAEFNKKYWKELFGDLEQKGNRGKARDQVTAYAVERILSNANRNKREIKDVRVPRIHGDKSHYVKSATVKVDNENNKLIYTSFLGESVEIPYSGKKSLQMDTLVNYRKEKTNSVTTGGNFQLKQRVFVAQLQKNVDAQYDPVDFLGFDINLEKGCWLVFNKNHDELNKYMNMPEDIKDLVQKIKEQNKILADKRLPVKQRIYRTKQRRKQRYVWKEMHKELNKKCRKIAQEIIDLCIKNKYCLCIDNLASGEKNGTFGQDHLVELLKTMCENQRAPFYSIPTPYTSQTCSECGYKDAKNRNRNSFKCLKCYYDDDSHSNAAKNIANFGKKFYDNMLPFARSFGCPNNWSCDKVIEKFLKKN